jgi:hypothetical protein
MGEVGEKGVIEGFEEAGNWTPLVSRETEFVGGMRAAGYRIANPAARIRKEGCPPKKRKSRGPRHGFEIAMRLTAGCPIDAHSGPESGWCLVPGEPQRGKATYRQAVPSKPLCSCPADSSGPWKWPGAGERGSRNGCGIFSGTRFPACYVSGYVHVWPL